MRHQDVRLEEVYAYRQDKHANVVRVLARRAGVPLVRNDRADVRGHRRHVKNGVEVGVLEDVRVRGKDFVAGERLVVEARFLTPWSEHEEQESAERRRRLAQEQATVACERARRLLAERYVVSTAISPFSTDLRTVGVTIKLPSLERLLRELGLEDRT